MTDDDLIGKRLGEYQLEALLGRGGMARIYRAVDTGLKRHVVVKVIDPPFRNDPDYIMRFEREAQAIARLDHPNIVRLYRFSEQDGWLYMAMQYVAGADLEVVLSSYRADGEFIAPDDACRIIREICSALDYAHDKGVIHRDVKPANILLDQQGHAVLSDFGLVLLTEVGTRGEIFGSAHYLAPEQAISSAQVVPQSDLYSVGIIIYEMFTGDVPFKIGEPLDIALLHMSEQPQPPRELRPDLAPELEAVILKALAKKPEDRYPTGAALADALEHSLKGKPAPGSSPTVKHQTIPERVALNLAHQPLPPIPAGVDSSASQPQLVEITAPVVEEAAFVEKPAAEKPIDVENKPVVASSGRNFKYIGIVIGLALLLLLALLCAAWMVLPSLMDRFNQGGIAPTSQSATQTVSSQTEPAATLSALQTDAVFTSTSAPEASPTAPLPTSTLVSYQLLIVRGSGNDSIIIVNQSADAFPLSLLRLGDNQHGLNGSEWGVTKLENGACVGAWKKGKGNATYSLPDGLKCSLTGEQAVLDKKNWFGDSTFAVFYDGKQYGVCGKDQNQCLFTIAP